MVGATVRLYLLIVGSRMAEQFADVIAERILEARRPGSEAVTEVRARIGRPLRHPDPEGDWICPVQILGLGDEEVRQVYGIDAVQAITLALQMIEIDLGAAMREGVELRWLDSSEFGLPPLHPLRLEPPEADFRLGADERAKVAPGFDVDALERLLARIIPQRRAEILAFFQPPQDSANRPGQLIRIKDPELQPLLEEVWASMWDHVGATDEDIERDTYQYPGRQIARIRRASSR
jgi:uncharacterized protein DUF6968